MYILGIETSCDETAASVVKDGRTILSNVVVSQIDIFKAYGGVIPEVAARSHLEVILPVIHQAIKDAESADPDFRARNSAPSVTSSHNNPSSLNLPRQASIANPPSPSLAAIDAIAVTHTPGLLGSLLIGTLTARTFAILHDKPFFPVHHLKSHIYANWLTNDKPIEFPLLALVVSGGHTQIIRMTTHNQFEIIGTTRDDAVGECFDKVAKILGLPYPGGPSISQAAKTGDQKKYHFPHPKLTNPPRSQSLSPQSPDSQSQPDRQSPNSRSCHNPNSNLSSKIETVAPSLDFSFSGLKTAVLREVQKSVGKPISFPSHELKNLLTKQQVSDFAASFEDTATDILIENLNKALELYPDTQSICLAGGVSANQLLRHKFQNNFNNTSLSKNPAPLATPQPKSLHTPFSKNPALLAAHQPEPLNTFFPTPALTGDNGAMVAAAAFYEIQSGVQPSDPYSLTLAPRSPICQQPKS